MAAMAPFAPPAAPPSAPIAKPVASGTTAPLAPFGLPAGYQGVDARALVDDDDPFAPLAPYARGAPEVEAEGVPGGPYSAVQYNENGVFVGTSNFLYNNDNQAILLNGSMYFVSGSGGTLSALNGTLNLSAAQTVNMVSQNGGVNIQASGPNVVNISTASTGFVAIQGILFRTTGVQFSNYPLTMLASLFQVVNSAQTVAFLSVNPNYTGSGSGSPIRMQGLPTTPVGLSVGDVWNNGGVLSLWTGLETASVQGGGGGSSLFGIFGAIVSTAAAVMHWAGGLRIPRPGRILPRSWLD